MSYAAFAKRVLPVTHPKGPERPVKPRAANDFRSGDIVYYSSTLRGQRIYGRVRSITEGRVWADWRYPTYSDFAFMPVDRVHLHTGEIPPELLTI